LFRPNALSINRKPFLMSEPRSGFAALGVPSELRECLDASGIIDPFPIQAAVIPPALAGEDVAGRAPTGSGKTLAFGLPLVARLQPASRRRPTALVLAPTRELATQIARELRPYVRRRGHEVVSVYGGVGYGPQRQALDAGAELVVACPGRLEDLLASGLVCLDDVGFVVVDEADRMADMGFLPAVRRILQRTNENRQLLLFSATFDATLASLRAMQRDAAVHEVGHDGPDMTAARHVFWRTAPDDRAATAAAAVKAIGSTIVFCRTRHGADRLVKQLQRLGTTAAAIHGGRSQAQREHALRSFARGDVESLVATDVAARGVHVDRVDGVLHFDPPSDATSYIHRSGRTARAGASGVVVSLVHPAAMRATRQLQRDAGIDAAITAVDVDDLAPRSSPTAVTSIARHRPPRPTREPGRFSAASTTSIPSASAPSPGGRRRPPTRQRRRASTTR